VTAKSGQNILQGCQNNSVLMLVATLLGAPLPGLLYPLVAQYINLLLISQLVAGALLGGLLALAIQTGKCRNTRMAVACGMVMLAAAAIAQSSAASRFCERCDEWWKTTTVHKTHPDMEEALVAKAQAGDWQGLRAVVSDQKTNEKNYCHIILSR
jgi:hypothetical protein